MEDRKLISRFKRNSYEDVRISLKSCFGKFDFIEFQIWEMLEPGSTGAEHPTNRGISLSIDFLPELIKALKEAENISKKEVEKHEKN